MPLKAGISVIVPVHTQHSHLDEIVARVGAALGPWDHEVILVDDCGPLDVWPEITRIVEEHPEVVGVRLGRNAGQHNALLAGIREASFAIAVTMDDDLQNPPEEIPALLGALTPGVDVVYGVPREVAQRAWRRHASHLARTFISSALGADSASEMTSFRAFRTELRDGFSEDVGPYVSIDALLSWSTESFVSVSVAHSSRAGGESNYRFWRLVRYAVDTATGFSARPLQAATTLGLIVGTIGLLLLFFVIGRVVLFGVVVPGFAFLASMIAFFSGVQLFALGVIGEYLSRMHFRLMRKPSYVVRKVVGSATRGTGDNAGSESNPAYRS